MANAKGLQKTLEHIKEHPKEWDQHRWHMCFAGIALRVLRGAVIVGDADPCCALLQIDGETVFSLDVADLAQEALELTGLQARALFSGSNTLLTLTGVVKEITDWQSVMSA